MSLRKLFLPRAQQPSPLPSSASTSMTQENPIRGAPAHFITRPLPPAPPAPALSRPASSSSHPAPTPPPPLPPPLPPPTLPVSTPPWGSPRHPPFRPSAPHNQNQQKKHRPNHVVPHPSVLPVFCLLSSVLSCPVYTVQHTSCSARGAAPKANAHRDPNSNLACSSDSG
ncbi:hypothetical protein GALMADRAFT_147740 [Galerina marginata CBS 339.88]|uniref:Uncharacterized protein n=1 Tax=Galerina marginata (strain CBS 339.88) TaxID=685588 RepID=A0A067S7A5_GALM3|nr:hypothetical protein GALMADRAFT_147740 [Galerina marginata CBS 339.88]